MIGNAVQFEGLIDIVIADGSGGADGVVVGSPGAAARESKIAPVRLTVGVRRRSSPPSLPRRRPFWWGWGREGGWASDVGGDDKAPQTMAAAAAALAALLSAWSAQ